MANLSALPPASKFKLNDDIIFIIFICLLDTSSEHRNCQRYPLLLSISQVCRTWRTLALNAPILWNRLDVLALSRKSKEWCAEVIERTRGAPLDIYGVPDPMAEFWNHEFRRVFVNLSLDLLRKFWPRIRTIELEFRLNAKERMLVDADKLGKIFNQPAEMLTTFSVSLFKNQSKIPSSFEFLPILLGGSRPLLRHFASDRIYPHAALVPSLNQLSSLHLCQQYTALEALKLVENLPSLWSLQVSLKSDPNPTVQPLPYLTHPSITRVRLESPSLVPIIDVLDHIRTGHRLFFPTCVVTASERFMPQVDISRITTFQQIAKSFASVPTTSQCKHSVYVMVATWQFEVTVWYERDLVFRFRVLTLEPFRMHHSDEIPALMDLFLLCDFTGVKSISLRVDENFRFYGISADAGPTLYHRLASVESLQIWIYELAHFEYICLSSVFPRLAILCTSVIPPSKSSCLAVNWCAILVRILEDWHPCYSQTKLLDLPNKLDEIRGKDFSLVDNVQNLHVRWQGGEYTCGTGHPEVLDFSSPVEVS